MIPMPPSRASAIASPASVTVSIAAETMGMLRRIFFVSCVAVPTFLGCTFDRPGTRRTSSNVSPSLITLVWFNGGEGGGGPFFLLSSR